MLFIYIILLSSYSSITVLLCTFVCYVSVCVQKRVHMYVYIYGRRLMPAIFYHSIPFVLRRYLSLNLELTDLARLAVQ